MSNDNFNEIINEMKNKKSKKDAQDYLMSRLSSEQSQKLNEILGDRKALEQLLQSPAAKELYKKFTEDKNG